MPTHAILQDTVTVEKTYHPTLLYLLSLLLIFIPFLLKLLLTFQFGDVSIYPLLFLGITISASYAGYRPTVFASFIAAIEICYLYFMIHPFPSFPPLAFILEVVIFLFGSLLLAKLLKLFKQADKVSEYKKQTNTYAKKLLVMQDEYKKALDEIKARDEFLSIASHELKTPLTSMLLQFQNALHNIRNVSLANFSIENLLKMLENAEQQIKRLNRMINDLLNISLITTGKLDLEKEEVDLTNVTQAVIERFSEKIKREGYQVDFTSDKPVTGYWDKLRLEQVITNLLSNAIKYGDHKPIAITVNKLDSIAKLTVEDHGIGIQEDLQKRIFNRFERAVSPKDFKGLGVGLYITAQIVKAHKGHISVKSRNGKGAIFVIELPIIEAKKTILPAQQ